MSQQRLHNALRRLGDALHKAERLNAVDNALSVSQLRVLSQLGEADEALTVTELAQKQCLALSTMTRNVDVLIRRGWVSKVTGTADKRTVNITLTENGQSLREKIEATNLALLNRAFRNVHPSERVERAAALNRVAASLEEVTRSA